MESGVHGQHTGKVAGNIPQKLKQNVKLEYNF